MRTSKEIGKIGEEYAEKHLKKQGYKVIANNYAVAGSELDLVAYKRGALVFVEVKTRSSNAYGSPAEAVTTLKLRKLRAAARGFWYEQQKFGCIPVWSRLKNDFTLKKVKSARLDIAEIYLDCGSVRRINIIENAEDYIWLIKKD